MNIAILIGVSKYSTLSQLPTCKIDVRKMKELIKGTGKFSEILFFEDDTDKYLIEPLIKDLLNKYKGQGIDELFFYYSGHGKTINEELYLSTSTTDVERLSETCLSNSWLDNIFRELNPKLMVKLI